MASRSYVKRQKIAKVLKRTLIFIWFLLVCLIIAAGYKIYQQSITIIENKKVVVGKGDKSIFDPNVMLMLYDDQHSQTKSQIYLIKFNESEKKITTVGLPNIIDTTVKYKTGSLAEQYDYGGSLQLKSAVENLFSAIVDKYIICPFSAIETVVDEMGGIEFDIEESLYYKSEDKVLTDLSVGLQTLNGQQVLEYLRYSWPDDYSAANRQAELLSIGLKKLFNNSSKITSIFTKISNQLQTDVSIIDIYTLNDKVKSFEQDNFQYIEIQGMQNKLDSDVFNEISQILKEEVTQ